MQVFNVASWLAGFSYCQLCRLIAGYLWSGRGIAPTKRNRLAKGLATRRLGYDRAEQPRDIATAADDVGLDGKKLWRFDDTADNDLAAVLYVWSSQLLDCDKMAPL